MIAIVGAGAAGLATAIFAARRGATESIVVFEGARQPGAKILISGGRPRSRAVIVSRAGRGAGVPAYRYLVQGRVQGVGYRYYVLRQAEALAVSGFARNQADGSVEVVAEGSDAALADLEQRLREGPAFAEVRAVAREAIAERGSSGFHIR